MENTSTNQILDELYIHFSVDKNAVQLFQATSSGQVATRRRRHVGRTMLCLSEQMESLVCTEAAKACTSTAFARVRWTHPPCKTASTRQDFINRQPMGRLAQAAEIAPIVTFLASDDSIFATGIAYMVDGGMTI